MLLAAGCAKESKNVVEQSESTPIQISVTADDATKSQWLDGSQFTWNDGDKDYFGIVTAAGNSAQSSAIEIDDDGFGTVTIAPTASEGDKMVLYYPYLSWKSDKPSVSDDKASVPVYIGATQTQYAGGQHYWLNDKIILGGKNVLEYGSETTYSTKMVALSSLVRFVVYSTNGSTEKISSVTFAGKSATVPLTGNVTETIYFDGTAPEIGTGDGGYSVTGSVDNTFTPGSSKSDTGCSILVGVLPSTVTGFTITVATSSGKKYLFESESAITFKAGNIKNVNLNLDKATSTITPGDEETVWEGSFALSDKKDSWDNNFTELTWYKVDFKDWKAGDEVTFYYDVFEGATYTCFKAVLATDWNKYLPSLGEQKNPSVNESSYSFTLTQDDIDAIYYEKTDDDGNVYMESAGFAVQGSNMTFTKVTIKHNTVE